MQNFQNTADQTLWAFEDDVVVTNTNGIYSFTSVVGDLLSVPTTLVPYIPVAPSNAQLLDQAQQIQISNLNQACGNAITNGFSFTIDGKTVTITLSLQDQTNLSLNAATAQTSLSVAEWQASKVYPTNSMVMVNGTVLVSFEGGTSGTTEPTAPAAFREAVTDNTITWYKLGFWIGTTTGNVMTDPATTVQIYGQMVVFINSCRSKYQTLKDLVMAATTVADVRAVVWS